MWDFHVALAIAGEDLCFIAALAYSAYWATISRPPYFPHIEEIAS
jgi:hypothetical protein